MCNLKSFPESFHHSLTRPAYRRWTSVMSNMKADTEYLLLGREILKPLRCDRTCCFIMMEVVMLLGRASTSTTRPDTGHPRKDSAPTPSTRADTMDGSTTATIRLASTLPDMMGRDYTASIRLDQEDTLANSLQNRGDRLVDTSVHATSQTA